MRFIGPQVNQVVNAFARVACDYVSPMMCYDTSNFIIDKLLNDCIGFFFFFLKKILDDILNIRIQAEKQ